MPTSLHSAAAALVAADLDTVLLPLDRARASTSWWGHVPFARLLVAELKPRTIVDLAAEDGTAFSALCSAVKLNRLTTQCYAIDTWPDAPQPAPARRGQKTSLAAWFVQRHYAPFAALVAGSPGPAAGLFADGAVDLLHLGGTHESVASLFQAWLPKLSSRGVVLMHGTLNHEDGGELRRLWKELSQAHPSFEFHHSGGLGIVAPGTAAPDVVSSLAALSQADAAALRRQLTTLAGTWLPEADKAHERARIEAAARGEESLPQQLADLHHRLAATTQEADLLRLQLERLRTSVSWRAMGPYRILGRLLKRRVIVPLRTPRWQRQQRQDFARITRSDAFDASFYLGRESPPDQRDHVIRAYLEASRKGIPRSGQHPGAPPRRPVPGFHPLAYAAQCAGYDEATGEDPLAHYLRTGMPEGPWKHEVIRAYHPPVPGRSGMRILVHAHFHYPDLLTDMLGRLQRNTSAADLLITTTSGDKAAAVEDILAAHDAKATVLVVPNAGRDIGPLLVHFDRTEGYDVVGHLHGKRSPQQEGAQGDNWRTFLWDHLLGDGSPMLDVIADAFAKDARLGLMLAEDPNLNHWDMNARLAEELARRLRLPEPLPPHFEFPKGTMFYTRPAALRPLVDLGWTWNDFPAEPIDWDGTILHTLERILAFSAAKAGFGLAAVHVPHSWRLPVM